MWWWKSYIFTYLACCCCGVAVSGRRCSILRCGMPGKTAWNWKRYSTTTGMIRWSIGRPFFWSGICPIRVINRLNKWINITNYWLEDVSIDIRVLTDGYKSYSWQYQKSNRLDENIRKATILRDGGKCMECGKSNCRLEVHHIKPRRRNGSTFGLDFNSWIFFIFL